MGSLNLPVNMNDTKIIIAVLLVTIMHQSSALFFGPTESTCRSDRDCSGTFSSNVGKCIDRMNAATRPVPHASMMLTVLDKITVHKDPAFTDQGVIGDIEDNDYWIIKISF